MQDNSSTRFCVQSLIQVADCLDASIQKYGSLHFGPSFPAHMVAVPTLC